MPTERRFLSQLSGPDIFFILLLVISMAFGCVLYLLFSSNQHGIVRTHIKLFLSRVIEFFVLLLMV